MIGMIKEILRAIRDGGLLNKGDIANDVGIQESTLESVLSLLSSKGYLKRIEGTEEMSKGCIVCPTSRECMKKPSTGNSYIITKKGKNYLEKI
ncbi:MAG: hypothetical protein L6N95_05665 [Candidatus Methylarchaceae archaeon HK01B]|nr:hypothetical protein [Candidatus Methylarchaceae archaeon HK01B]